MTKVSVDESDLPEVLPGIDMQTALKMVGGKKRLLKNILREFADASGDALPQVNALLAAGDTLGAGRLVHNMKGNAGIIGATGLHQAARVLEENLKSEKDLSQREEALALFCKELLLVLETSRGV